MAAMRRAAWKPWIVTAWAPSSCTSASTRAAPSRVTIAAAIPPGVLAESVERVVNDWRVEKDPGSAAGCRIPSSAYVNVRFVLE